MQHFLVAPRAMAVAATRPDGHVDADALPGARRLLAYSALAILLLAITVFVAVMYAVWRVDDTATNAEMSRARVALAVTAVDLPGSEARLASTLDNAYALEGAHFGDAAEVKRGEVAVAVPGDETRLLIWTPRRFGTELFIQLAPMRISSSLVFLAGIVFLMRRLYLLTRELEERRREAQALAARDTLTGLANRLGFERGLARLLAEGHSNVGLFYLDLDGFKQINDTLGHGAGDEVLQAVGERLARLTRNCDTLARIGGDEFALLRPVPGEREHLLETARDIELALGEPVTVGTTAVEVRASIGIAVAPADGECGKALLEAADVALYRAKRDGTGVALAAAA
jgi:diguanylate cyclase (GGDEF)-like protein